MEAPVAQQVTAAPGLRLLALIDALVRRDVDKPDFKGRVGLGVRGAAGDGYWRGVFDRKATSELLATPPSDVDALLVMSQEAAESILMRGDLPERGGELQLSGDGELLKRFFARYTTKRTWLDIRAGR